MSTIAITNEYGIVIRRAALTAKNISDIELLKVMEAERPLDSNSDLVSFGPSFGEEAMNVLISKLQALGLEYVDDFFAIAFDVPAWCRIRMEINK